MTRIGILAVACVATICLDAAHAGELLGAEVWGSPPQLVRLDRRTAQSTSIGPLGIDGPFGLTYSSTNDTVYGIEDKPWASGLYSVNVTTGAATLIGTNGVFAGIVARGLAWRATTNELFTVDQDTNRLYEINALSGSLEGWIALTNSGGYFGITYDNATDQLYGVASVVVGQGTGRHLTQIDPTTGEAKSILSLGSGNDYRGLAWDPELNVFWTHNNTTGYLTILDPSTQSIIPMGSTLQPGLLGTGINALVFIPAPSAVPILILAATIGGKRRRNHGSA